MTYPQRTGISYRGKHRGRIRRVIRRRARRRRDHKLGVRERRGRTAKKQPSALLLWRAAEAKGPARNGGTQGGDWCLLGARRSCLQALRVAHRAPNAVGGGGK